MARRITRSWLKIVLVGLTLVVTMACAKKSFIYVDYQLPPVTYNLEGRTVFVETNDLRASKEVFNHRAQKVFKDFTGLFSLTLIKPDDEKALKGAYPLPMLFETALKERLQNLGIHIEKEKAPNTPIFKIEINQFRVNLVGQKWIADISYEVHLTQDQKNISRETVTGSAERLKIMGSGGAEKIVGEIFTEMINRLDIRRLFQQANL